jgi:hypothetical protein
MNLEKFVVDSKGSVWSQQDDVRVPLNVNVFTQTGFSLFRGRYERTGFGMTALEKEAAVYLGFYE